MEIVDGAVTFPPWEGFAIFLLFRNLGSPTVRIDGPARLGPAAPQGAGRYVGTE